MLAKVHTFKNEADGTGARTITAAVAATRNEKTMKLLVFQDLLLHSKEHKRIVVLFDWLVSVF